jgi:anti-anti-sigma factor
VLRIATVEQGTTSTIEFEGEWDLGRCNATRDVVAQALQLRPERFVLDLSRLSFIDSSGIHSLIQAQSAALSRKPGW